MSGPVLGAHAVSHSRLYSVARVAGLLASLWAIFSGIWLVVNTEELFLNKPAWEPMVEVVGNHLDILGWTILFGGTLGILGLATRNRFISTASSIICIVWSGWFVAFLWYANFTGPANVASLFALLSGLVFVLRFWLLWATPDPAEPRGNGW